MTELNTQEASKVENLKVWDKRTLSNPELNFVKVNSRGVFKFFKIIKCNPSNVVGLSLENDKKYNIPYQIVVDAFKSLEDNGKHLSASKVEDLSEFKIGMKYLDPKYKFVKVKERNKVSYFSVDKTKENRFSGRSLESGSLYDVPYSLIVEAYEKLPEGVDDSKIKNFNNYDKNSLLKMKKIKIEINNEIVIFDILKLNPQRVKAKNPNSHMIYSVPYESILEAF